MSFGHDSVCDLLIDIRTELQVQINANEPSPQMEKLIELSTWMPNKLMVSDLPTETIRLLNELMDMIGVTFSSQESLQSHLIVVTQFINKLCPRSA